MAIDLDGLPTTLAAAEQAVEDSVRCGPARYDLTLAQRQEWADRHRALITRREALRAAAQAGGGRRG